ncbi:response regulator [Cohnella soli]|uniref:Response regulator n=1 Tax=Cohnella soli TaxID=425005 RepID=A0ABW0HY00_9BACL
MYRVLVVDNEPIIVDGLFSLFQELDSLELDVMKAYSAFEAIECLKENKVDVVVADIHMPGLSGIELQQIIRERWPKCKVIMLTGYNDFNYAQTVIRQGGFDYILKTEGDVKIIDSLSRAIGELQQSESMEDYLSLAKEQLLEARRLLQNELLLQIVEEIVPFNEKLQERLLELDIVLHADRPLFAVACRVDEWGESYSLSDRMLMMFAVENIAREYLADANFQSLSLDRHKFIWLVQYKQEQEWDGFGKYVRNMLSEIQTTSQKLLRTTLSFAVSEHAIPWGELARRTRLLRQTLEQGLGLGKGVVIRENTASIEHVSQQIRVGRSLVELERCLEARDVASFRKGCRAVLEKAIQRHSLYTEVYYSIAVMLWAHVNRLKLNPEEGMKSIESLLTWEAAADYLTEITSRIIEQRGVEQLQESHELIDKLHRYIEANLVQDLSLTRLSGVVYLNGAYLSRVYKQMTGIGLTEYIADKRLDKAKQLLIASQSKIKDIAESVGLETGYFIKLFRKREHMTPQEYRKLKL